MHNHDCYVVLAGNSPELLNESLFHFKLATQIDLHKAVQHKQIAAKQALGVDDQLDRLLWAHHVTVVNDEQLVVGPASKAVQVLLVHFGHAGRLTGKEVEQVIGGQL